MNRPVLCCLISLGLWLAASLVQAQPQPYRFDLKAEKLDVPASPWRVVQVLDLRPDRSRLGTVRRGFDNLTGSADFKQPLAAELAQFIQTNTAANPGARPVLMRVFMLTISEGPHFGSESAEAELVVDFLEPQADSTFRVVLTAGETTRRSGIEVTGFHAANIALLLQQALRRLAATPTPTTETLSRTDALAGRGGATSQRFAIQTATAPKRGLYLSAEDFRNNTPHEPTRPFYIKHIPHSGKRWAGADELRPINLSDDPMQATWPMETTGLWGLSDGRDLLIAYRSRFYQLLPAADGRSYTFMGPPLYDEKTASTAALVGGLAGGAMAAGVASAISPLAPYELHLSSGRVVATQQAGQTDAQGFTVPADSAHIYIYRSNAAKDQSITVSATGQKAVTLAARQYLVLSWLDRRQELKICLQTGAKAEACRSFVPDFAQPSYFECTVPTDGSPPMLRPVSVKAGAFEVQHKQRVSLE